MEEFDNARENLSLAASQVRVLADLMLPSTDLQDVDRPALAHVLQDLAARLDRNLDRLEGRGDNIRILPTHREERP